MLVHPEMRRNSARLTAAIALTLYVQVAAQSPPVQTAPARAGVLTGLVLVEQGSQLVPLRRATVSLRRGTQSPLATATGLDGRYRFEELADGKYEINISKAGFTGASAAEATFIEISPATTNTADFRMQRAAALEGRFLDDTG